MANIEINSAKLKGSGVTHCEYSYEQKTESAHEAIGVSSDAPVHDDMRLAFRALVPHLAFICEEVDNSNELIEIMDRYNGLIEDGADTVLMTRLAKYKVTSFKCTGTGDTAGIILSGQKKLITDKIVNLNTPNLKWDDDYQFSQELYAAIERCKTEVLHYMEGKQAPEVQGSLFGEVADAVYENEEASE